MNIESTGSHSAGLRLPSISIDTFMEEIWEKNENFKQKQKPVHENMFSAKSRKCNYDLIALSRRIVRHELRYKNRYIKN